MPGPCMEPGAGSLCHDRQGNSSAAGEAPASSRCAPVPPAPRSRSAWAGTSLFYERTSAMTPSDTGAAAGRGTANLLRTEPSFAPDSCSVASLEHGDTGYFEHPWQQRMRISPIPPDMNVSPALFPRTGIAFEGFSMWRAHTCKC